MSLRPFDGYTKHGWMRQRPDGAVVRCGGPALCAHCQREFLHVHGRLHPATKPSTVLSWSTISLTNEEVLLAHLASYMDQIVVTAAGVLAVVEGHHDYTPMLSEDGVYLRLSRVDRQLELDPETI